MNEGLFLTKVRKLNSEFFKELIQLLKLDKLKKKKKKKQGYKSS